MLAAGSGLYVIDERAVLSVNALAPGRMHLVERTDTGVSVRRCEECDAWKMCQACPDELLDDAIARLWFAVQTGEAEADFAQWVFTGQTRSAAYQSMLAAALVLLAIAFGD